jgi:hypothetical protein
MISLTARRTALAVGGVFVAIALVIAGVFLVLGGDAAQTPQVPATVSPSASPTGDTMNVKVYFHRGASDPRDVVAADRTVPKTSMVATAALNQLLAGPTAAERDSGLWSFFSDATANMLRSVRVANGVARVDFRDFSKTIPNASTSTGSAILLAELDATVRQFGNVRTAIYSFNGNIDAFYHWLQYESPVGQPPAPQQAIDVARDFMVHLVGMANPQEGLFRSTGPGLGAVEFNPPPGEDGKPLTGIVTTVHLQRSAASWVVTGATTQQIQVDQPARLQAVSSPVPVSGRALAWEGNVEVRVLQVTKMATTELGNGFVTGGGAALSPFTGAITFNKPSASAGWLVFFERSANDGSVIRSTAVEVTFAGLPAQPHVLGVRLQPNLAVKDGWLLLPTGRGSLTLTVQATATDTVRLLLTPTGNEQPAKPLGEVRRSADQFTYTWRYADEPLLAHLTVVAAGPGGRTEYLPFTVYHG